MIKKESNFDVAVVGAGPAPHHSLFKI